MVNIMSEFVLLLPNTDRLQQGHFQINPILDQEYKPVNSFRILQLSYANSDIIFKVKIMSEVGLLLPNTDRFQQDEDYVRGWTTSTKY
jgi:hypothetical protein